MKIALLIEHTSVSRAPSPSSFESRIYLLDHQSRTIPLKDPKYDSDTGRTLGKQILTKYPPYEPHTYQLDGIFPALDGIDLLVTSPTGSGKMFGANVGMYI